MAAKDAAVRIASATYAANTHVSRLSTAERAAMAETAREGMRRKLETEALTADPTLADNPDELAARVAALRKLHLARMNLLSVQSKARARAEQEAAREAAELDALAGGGE